MTFDISILKPGMVGVNRRDDYDPLSTIATVMQGDTDAEHVWLVLPNGKIATTGAKMKVFYGEVDPKKYCRKKRFSLLETVSPLTQRQLAIIQFAHEQMFSSGIFRLYGGWKFLQLELLAASGDGSLEKTGNRPKLTAPKWPICSQAVAYPLWSAGVPVGKGLGKLDYTTVLPETIAKEAAMTNALLMDGFTPPEGQPCYKLKTVDGSPFVT